MSKGGCQDQGQTGFGSGFALLVVLFILLVIIGTAYTGNTGGYGSGHGGYC